MPANANSSNGFCCVQDYENHATNNLPRSTFDFYQTGACSLQTVRNNQESFRRLRIRPRCLRDVTVCDITTKVLDTDVEVPIGVAPTGVQKLAHPDGEIANARGCNKLADIKKEMVVHKSFYHKL